MYRISALAAGATPVTAPETDRVVDPEAILAAVTERTRLIFIANPANPTGTMLPLAAFEDLAARLPDQCLLVMDGAYVEYADGYDGGAKLVETRDNVVMTRTFSKVYGLGGVRVGIWLRAEGDHRGADAHPRSLQPVEPWPLMGAEAALRDTDWVAKALRVNADEKTRAPDRPGCVRLAWPATTAPPNFVLARFFRRGPRPDAADAHLKKRGIIVRAPKSYGLPHCLRITVGRPQDNDAVLGVLREVPGGRDDTDLRSRRP